MAAAPSRLAAFVIAVHCERRESPRRSWGLWIRHAATEQSLRLSLLPPELLPQPEAGHVHPLRDHEHRPLSGMLTKPSGAWASCIAACSPWYSRRPPSWRGSRATGAAQAAERLAPREGPAAAVAKIQAAIDDLGCLAAFHGGPHLTFSAGSSRPLSRTSGRPPALLGGSRQDSCHTFVATPASEPPHRTADKCKRDTRVAAMADRGHPGA